MVSVVLKKCGKYGGYGKCGFKKNVGYMVSMVFIDKKE